MSLAFDAWRAVGDATEEAKHITSWYVTVTCADTDCQTDAWRIYMHTCIPIPTAEIFNASVTSSLPKRFEYYQLNWVCLFYFILFYVFLFYFSFNRLLLRVLHFHGTGTTALDVGSSAVASFYANGKWEQLVCGPLGPLHSHHCHSPFPIPISYFPSPNCTNYTSTSPNLVPSFPFSPGPGPGSGSRLHSRSRSCMNRRPAGVGEWAIP